MLSIGRLADYVGVTPRAIRHYHRIGLLPEPERADSGYRMYTAQDVVDLQRIKVLSDAGVPLARVRELVTAGPEEFRVGVAHVDDDIRRRIRELRSTRRSLAELMSADEPFLPPEAIAGLERMREHGVSERLLELTRDAWLLVQVLYPGLMSEWLRTQLVMLQDEQYRELYLLTGEALEWQADDPRIDDLARRTVDWARRNQEPDTSNWEADSLAEHLVMSYQRDSSPAWRRLMERIDELMSEEPGRPVDPLQDRHEDRHEDRPEDRPEDRNEHV